MFEKIKSIKTLDKEFKKTGRPIKVKKGKYIGKLKKEEKWWE